MELAADAVPERTRQLDAVVHRAAVQRHEGHDIGGPHAGMHPGVRGEIDQITCRADAGKRGFAGRVRRPGKGEDGTVMPGIGGNVE